MPVHYLFEAPSTFAVHAAGEVTHAEVRAAILEMAADERLGPGAMMLTDARAVTGAPSASELRSIARDLRMLRDRGMVAFATVAADEFVFGIARMVATFATAAGVRAESFLSVAAARVWLAQQARPEE